MADPHRDLAVGRKRLDGAPYPAPISEAETEYALAELAVYTQAQREAQARFREEMRAWPSKAWDGPPTAMPLADLRQFSFRLIQPERPPPLSPRTVAVLNALLEQGWARERQGRRCRPWIRRQWADRVARVVAKQGRR